ncbi:hypothetical protein BHU62_03020 [Serratia marcescens]|uniref:Uncharacterized protein n=1 Tax=Serratia marcescens TaxID=615 RepID=A0A1Q4P4E5_SERMA|nr:hypothetical protein BHU62_03020 [Serratia marcescens]
MISPESLTQGFFICKIYKISSLSPPILLFSSQYCCRLINSLMPNWAFLLNKKIAILSRTATYPLTREKIL